MLDPSRLKKAETIFQSVLEAPSERRSSVLAQACEGDEELGAFVSRLLKHDDSGMSGFLSAGPVGSTESQAGNRLKEPLQIGSFRLLRRISEGGMGVVFEAEQANPRRTVALKIIRGGRFADEYSVKLFQRETQALARLRHPCVGAIYEAGRTDEGQHYFAMEYVAGRPLAEYVREKRLGIRERLKLFCNVCEAIHYAHQRGVMHRDLKPTNILVDDEGHPKILDFGLARIADANLGVFTAETATGRIQGTLSYMSPEQARGNPDEIDTRSDVYSLGVILYELLTDKLPYDVMGLPLPKAVEIVCTQPPRMLGDLSGDLETITFKALEKEPRQRYASAAALAEDVQRCLTNQPIEARRHSGWYVLRKTLCRHRVAASVAVAFVALISVSAIALAFMYQRQSRARQAEAAERLRAESEARRANQETEKAIEERNKTEKFAEFMEETLKGATPWFAKGRDTKMLRDLMDAARKRIEEGELFDVPAAEIRLRNTIGKVYNDIAEFDAAERMLGPAIALAEKTHGSDSTEYATALQSYALCLNSLARYSEALTLFEKSFAIRRRIHAGDHSELTHSLNNIGFCLSSLGRQENALATFEEALAMSNRLYSGDHEDVAISLTMVAGGLEFLGRADEALPYYRKAMAMKQRLYPGDHPEVARGINNYAGCLSKLGREGDALPMFEQVLAMNQRLFPGDNPHAIQTLNNLANCHLSLGRYAEAVAGFEKALAMSRRLYSGDHPDTAQTASCVATCLVRLGRPADAITMFEEALAVYRRLFPGDHPDVAWALNNLGYGLHSMGRSSDALPPLEEALAMTRRLNPGDHPDVARGLNNVGAVFQIAGRTPEALPMFEEALAMYRRIYPGDHSSVAVCLGQVGRALDSSSRSAEALTRFEEALVMSQRLYPEDHPDVADALIDLASGLQSVGRLPEALDRCEEGLAVARRVHPPSHTNLRAAEIRKGAILTAMNRYDEAGAILVPAWKDVADRSDVLKRHKRLCLETLVKLFEARHKAEPGNGHGDKAVEYGAVLASLRP